MKKPVFFTIAVLVLTALACSFNFSTANVSEAKMSRDADGNQPTTTFAQDDTFYLVVEVANAPDDTTVKAVWTAVEAEGVEPNFSLGEKELTGGGTLNFTLTNDQLWPAGNYKVDLYLNDELDRTLEFEVEGTAVVQESTATPEPTATPVSKPTATAESNQASESSTGDSLDLEPTATPEPEYEPLPFKDEPYVHPSGAFTFALPESWEGISGDETSVVFGDDASIVGVIFRDEAAIYSDDEMQGFIDGFLQAFLGEFSDRHEVLVQEVQPDDSIYVGTVYETDDGHQGDADFFFEQRKSVIFVLFFVTTRYEEMSPTWDEIIASYSVDADAALAAAPAKPAAPTVPAPPPGPSVPAGKGLLIFRNNTGVDFVIDVIGPTNTSEVVPPHSSKEFTLDPGHYTINGHSPGGDYVIDAYQFDLSAGQAFPLNLN